MNRVVKEIEDICRKGQIPIRDGVVFGVTPSFGVIASQMPVLTTDVSILGFSIPFFVFGNAITKAMAKTLVYLRLDDGKLAVDNRPSSIRKS